MNTNDRFAQTFHEALSLAAPSDGLRDDKTHLDGMGGPEYYGALALVALMALYTWMNGDS